VTGANGQIGAELVRVLSNNNTNNSSNSNTGTTENDAVELVVAGFHKLPDEIPSIPYEIVDVCDKQALMAVLKKHKINIVYHLAAMLSSQGEKNPDQCWATNVDGLRNVLDCARDLPLHRVFWSSSVAVYGPSSAAKENTPQNTFFDPASIYGCSKVAGETLCNYYHRKWQVDVRSLRYPGIISHDRKPNGSIVDYSVEMFRDAVRFKSFSSYLPADAKLPYLHLHDTVRGTIELMETDSANVKTRFAYNIVGSSFSIEQLIAAIQKYVPDFKCDYKLDDFRCKLYATLPKSLDDSQAQKDWGWKATYDLEMIAKDMISRFSLMYPNP